jgi:hypothetical protein
LGLLDGGSVRETKGIAVFEALPSADALGSIFFAEAASGAD